MKPIVAHIPISANSRPGNVRPCTRAIIYHWTGMPGQTAEQAGAWFASLDGTDNYASAHYVVDDNVYEFIPPREIAYHAAVADARRYRRAAKDIVGTPPWRFAVGVEMCIQDAAGTLGSKTLENALVLGKELCLRFGLNPRHCVFRHHDMTGKICPKWFVDHPDEWELFIETMQDLVVRQVEFDWRHHRL